MFLLVPHEVTTTAATLWVAAVDEALPLNQLQLAPNMPGEMLPSNAGQWPRDAQQPRILHQEIVVSGLDPQRTYSFALMAGGRQLADAKVTTLPREMPLLGDKPFTVLLGSCFSRLEDKHGKVGSTFSQMRDDRPDIKILAGDQVYLDSPFEYFLAGTHTLAELHAKFVEQYTETWGRKGGLAALLKEGANFFCSDDHEFWNNAPNIAAHLLDTLPLIGKRDQWWKAARELYCAFQTGRPIQQFSVPPVSLSPTPA